MSVSFSRGQSGNALKRPGAVIVPLPASESEHETGELGVVALLFLSPPGESKQKRRSFSRREKKETVDSPSALTAPLGRSLSGLESLL